MLREARRILNVSSQSPTSSRRASPCAFLSSAVVQSVFAARVSHLRSPLHGFADWLDQQGDGEAAAEARRTGDGSALGVELALPGPVGERNLYALHPRGLILMRPATRQGLFRQMAAVLATGNRGAIQGMTLPPGLPAEVAACFTSDAHGPFAAALPAVKADAANVEIAICAMAARFLGTKTSSFTLAISEERQSVFGHAADTNQEMDELPAEERAAAPSHDEL